MFAFQSATSLSGQRVQPAEQVQALSFLRMRQFQAEQHTAQPCRPLLSRYANYREELVGREPAGQRVV
jgi:hypothetical protein